MSDTARSTLGPVRQRREELGGALGAVERAVAAPFAGDPATWAKALGVQLDALEAEWGQHVAVTEGVGGLHDEIVAEAPRLVHGVEQLQRDHELINGELAQVRAEVTEVGDADAAGALHDRVVALLAHLIQHRHRGANLVFDAFNVDISAE